MAQKVIFEFADDIDGSEATQTLTFSVRGVEYEIDLSDENASRFDEALAPYIGKARRIRGRRRPAARTGAVPEGVDPRAVRTWAAGQGIEIGPRGRIPATIVEQYQSAS